MSRLVPFAIVWLCLWPVSLTAAERPRLAVLTDIGGDPDDQQSMIRLMVYANEFDIELLIRQSRAGAAGSSGITTAGIEIAQPARERIHANS